MSIRSSEKIWINWIIHTFGLIEYLVLPNAQHLHKPHAAIDKIQLYYKFQIIFSYTKNQSTVVVCQGASNEWTKSSLQTTMYIIDQPCDLDKGSCRMTEGMQRLESHAFYKI